MIRAVQVLEVLVKNANKAACSAICDLIDAFIATVSRSPHDDVRARWKNEQGYVQLLLAEARKRAERSAAKRKT